MDMKKLMEMTTADSALKDWASKKDDSKIADWWNTVVDDVDIGLPISRESFLAGFVNAPFRIADIGDQAKRDAWRDALAIILALPSLDAEKAKTIIERGLADKVLTQEDADALYKQCTRKGTRAEGAFGVGVEVTEAMLHRARSTK